MSISQSLDIIIPTFNEAENISELFKRIKTSFNKAKLSYRLIVIDDNSTDGTYELLKKISKSYPLIYKKKIGRSGKVNSILEGHKYVKSDYFTAIDTDFQYPPEVLPEMFNLAVKNKLGVVIGNRVYENASKIKSIVSRVGRFIVGKLITGFARDARSGLKIIKSEVIKFVDLSYVYPWSIDVSVLYTARELGFEVGSVDIPFSLRFEDNSKIKLIKAAIRFLGGAIMQKLNSRKVYQLPSEVSVSNMLGAGIIYKKNKFLTHTTLNHNNSAIVTFTRFQKLYILTVIILFISFLFFYTKSTLIGFVAVLSTIYFIDVFFNLYLVLKSLHFPPELFFGGKDIKNINDSKLPIYTILCPMYREANVLPQFVESIEKMDYPKSKLEVLLLLEEDDVETINKAKELKLGSHFKILVVPHSFPKTKPKACNFGLAHATGDYVVIYDAEDIPDPDQLKKAVLGFNKLGNEYSCLQAKLNYHNPNQNWLTRLFTTEYSLWFDVMLPALQTVNTFIPLGGTSNHFRTSDLRKFEGWDPFNVTEDADLGVRLFRAGGKTAIIDSMTYEEANSNLKNWIRQRSRWIKGYLQTYLVHMRNPFDLAKKVRGHFLIFQMVAGLRMTFMIINPILWLMTLSYFLLYKFVGPQIESLYPASIFYMAITSAIFGNFLYVYYYMVGTAKHGQYQLIKYVFLVPIYWFFTSVAACVAFWQLLTKPHYWEKTIHGLVKSDKKKVFEKISISNLRNFGVQNYKKISDKLVYSGLFLVLSTLIVNIINFLYNAYLGRVLDLSEFGTISLIGSFLYLSQIPLSALSRTVTHKSAFFLGKYGSAFNGFWKRTRKSAIKISFLIAILWLCLTPYLPHFFRSESALPFLLFTPIWIIGFAGAVDDGYLGGNMKFIIEGLMAISQAVTKFIITIILVRLGFSEWIYVAIPFSILVSFTIGWIFSLKIGYVAGELQNDSSKFPIKFYISSILAKVSSAAFLSLDLILAKVFLEPKSAGLYSLLSLSGKIIYMIGNQFTQFIVPIISKNEGEGVSSNKTFYKLLSATISFSLLGFVGLGVFGEITVPFLFGEKTLPIIKFLPMFTIAMVMQVVIQSIISFHQSKNNLFFPVVNFVISTSSLLLIVFYHDNISEIVNVMYYSSLVSLIVVILLHLFESKTKIIFANIRDFAGLTQKVPSLNKLIVEEKLKILVFNWRDTRHAWAGGAEVYVHEIAKRWVKDGHLVTVFCGNDGKSPRNEVVDGVQMVRRGGFYTVYVWAFLYYILRFRKKYDVVIDSENGVPFFTPLYVSEPVIGLVYHIHQDVILKELKLPKYLLPIATLTILIERFVVPIVYKNTQMITISESSKSDMIKIGLGKNNYIKIVNPGVDLSKCKILSKYKNPTLLHVGRLKTYKSVDTIIKAVSLLIKSTPNVKLNIAGFGDEREKLEKLVSKLSLNNNITFLGKISDEKRNELMSKSWVFVYPSTFEGWGISAIEANASGTPVVASNVAGLRDSVKDGYSGLFAKVKDEQDFAEKISLIIGDKKLRTKLSKDAIKWANGFDWDVSANKFLIAINNVLSSSDSESINQDVVEISLN
jgi:cellulose synthase/poly-beta-1,6-N-acetylglucosamine synthase-like glycosyltransferase/glycosyltransferase involved in cell wall biosynthesis/O-antigen/teichoic acid export membrane protein